VTEFIPNETAFNDLLATGNVLVVDCTTSWSGPCRLVAPLIDRLDEEYGDRALVFKLDIDLNKSIASRFRINSIPAVLFFENGELTNRLTGEKTYEDFSSVLVNLLD
jgi:thioredoxin 1